MKLRIILCLLLILAIFSACAKNEITASAISDLPVEKQIEIEAKVVSVDACKDITCDANEHCEDGRCICNPGYKECNGECIQNSACCTENDCKSDESCRGHTCIPDNCKVNEEFNVDKNKCVCDKNSLYCAVQNKCIPKDNCCMHHECSNSDYRCTETNMLATLCISGEKKQCKSVYTDRGESFFLGKTRYDVDINHFLQNGGVDVDINEVNFVLKADVLEKLEENTFIYIESIEPLGGYCKKEWD